MREGSLDAGARILQMRVKMKTTCAEFPRDLKRLLALRVAMLDGEFCSSLKKNVESIQIVEPQKTANVRNTHNCLGTAHLALDNMCSALKLNCLICSTQTLNANTPHFMVKVFKLVLNHLYFMFSQCKDSHVCALMLALKRVMENMLLFCYKYAETKFNTDI